jgi:hypothetical protein
MHLIVVSYTLNYFFSTLSLKPCAFCPFVLQHLIGVYIHDHADPAGTQYLL